MKFDKERKVNYVEFDVDFSDEESQKLIDFALKRIVTDNNTLINYAINIILADYVEQQKELNHVKKFSKRKLLRKEVKNANKNKC